MKFPEECLRSCLQVCRGFSDAERPAWIVPSLVATAALVGFLVGRFDVTALIGKLERVLRNGEPRAILSQLSGILWGTGGSFRHHVASQVRTKHSCLIRTISIEEGKRAVTLNQKSIEVVKEHKSDDSPQPSPQSTNSSSNSGSGSFKKENLSPLLVGSKKSTPASSISSLENSPVGTLRRRRELELDAMEDSGCYNQSTSSGKPRPLSIPTSNTTLSDCGTPSLSSLEYERLQDLPDDGTIPAAAWMCGKDVVSMDLSCSSMKWLNLIEIDLDTVYGEDWSQRVHPDDLLRSKEVIARAVGSKVPFQMEYRLQVGQDHFRWVLDIGKPRFSSSLTTAEFLGFVGWRIDIHERKTIENNYWKYWTLPHEFLVTWSGDGQFFDNVSTSLPSFLGYTMEEFKAVPWIEWLHEEDKATASDAFSKLKDGKAVVNLVNRYRCRDGMVASPLYIDGTGTYKWLNWTANDMFAACRDITADKLAQVELQRSQQELQRLTDVIPGGVFLCRVAKEGTECFPYMSKGAKNLFNCEMKETCDHGGNLNRVFGLNVHPDDWPRLEAEMKLAVSTQAPLDHDYRVLMDRNTRWVRVHAVPRFDSISGSTEWSGIAWDITEQHQVVAALKEARDSAERAAQANRKFLAHMSHEIRTPMNAVIGMGALILETDLTDEQREYASTIRSSGEALLGIINDILDYSKIEAGKMELELQPTEILQCVEESFDLVAPQAAVKGLELTYNVTDSVPSVLLGDSARIRQILVNLLSNAVKFTEKGYISVNVTARQLEDPGRLPFKKFNRSLWEVEFSVADSGIGIPDDRKCSLFQAFTQGDTSTTRRYGGTGLGLAICARLCGLHGGRIWEANDRKEGSTFHFTVLAEDMPRYSQPASDHGDLPGLKNKRVLIVAGSSSSTQTMCSRLLKSWHMRPVCASTSDEALMLLTQMVDSASISSGRLARFTERSPRAFDVVIFDCSLLDAEDPQVMECLGVCHATLQTVPTLLLTPFGRRTRDYYSGKQPVQFDAYVSKPIKESHLLNALMSLVLEPREAEKEEYYQLPGAASARKPKKESSSLSPANNVSDLGKLYPLRILVAEDNIVNQKVILKLLLRLGYTADVVGNGREALDSVMRQVYDVILMDCFMPEMDGLEASRRIRENIRPTPVIVAVTAAALKEEMQACLEAGMHMYISKPIQADELMQTLGKCWRMKHTEPSQ
ncbi:peroxide stress-activated histidine kinase mak2 [Selaginella moellendorffii]|uniref:peroxide stress-activated histidine kinase mak2 n=1 Tax=Selaginella moellendorffii TaxID=88036 RepID=UPI000D1C6860|nr:peroxide stress-activated histidine kinase mak2 [Selaginella moellendorffii]|eukprot:XP_002980069.2 peroxide stress-activated histidine kinase mak2 [Selaginella moellendorffii]